MESNGISHGRLEFLFTIDEESGLTGASAFPGGLMMSNYFLNLDNEKKGTLCIVVQVTSRLLLDVRSGWSR